MICRLGNYISRAFSGIVPSRTTGDRKVSCISVGAIGDDGVDFQRVESIRIGEDGWQSQALCQGDVLISVRGLPGKVTVADARAEGAVVSANVAVLRLKSTLLPEVLWAYLTSSRGVGVLGSLARQSGVQSALRVSDLLEIEIPVPTMEQQKELVELVRCSADACRAELESARLRMQVTRQAVAEIMDASAKHGGKHAKA